MDLGQIIAYVIGAGGAASLIAQLTKYFLDRRKQQDKHEIALEKLEDQWVKAEFDRLTSRIVVLEGAYHNCITREAEKERQIGLLEGRLDGMQKSIDDLHSASHRETIQHATDTAKMVAEQVVDEKMKPSDR